MEKVRWGIVGAGNIANKFAKAIKNVECAELVAVASRSEASGKEFSEKYDIPNVFCGYEAMAASDLVDAVYVATPHPFHKPCAEIFLNAKKHVLCEKPICVTAAQAIELADCAKKNGVFLMEAMWTRFIPAIKEAKKIVDSGKIGEVLGITADFGYASSPEKELKIFENKMAGGSLLDVGIYGLTFAAIFLGTEPESVCSLAQIDYDVDCHTVVTMKYKTGAIATVTSAINLRKPNEGYIYGTKGYIRMPTFYGAKELYLTVAGETTHIEKPSIGDGFEEEIYEASNCIIAGKTESDIHPLSESIKIMQQMDNIRKQIGLKYPFDGEEFLK